MRLWWGASCSWSMETSKSWLAASLHKTMDGQKLNNLIIILPPKHTQAFNVKPGYSVWIILRSCVSYFMTSVCQFSSLKLPTEFRDTWSSVLLRLLPNYSNTCPPTTAGIVTTITVSSTSISHMASPFLVFIAGCAASPVSLTQCLSASLPQHFHITVTPTENLLS